MIIYCVLFLNDGDFPEMEVGLITTNEWEAKAKKKEKPDYYAISRIVKWKPSDVKEYETEKGKQILMQDWKIVY